MLRWVFVLMIIPLLARAAPDPTYDELSGKLAAAVKLKDDEQAATRYGDIARAAEDWLANPPDDRKLVANMKALRARAEKLGDAAHDRFIEKLEAELHAITPGQRAVVLKRGRPAVSRKKALTCWTYRDETAEEIYCWTKAGKIAEHTTTPIAPVEEATEPKETKEAKETKAKPKRKVARAYYAAATFASGSCKFSNCMKDGWSTQTPAGAVESSCRFSDCSKDGWSSTYPDGAEATTSCRFSDCFKDGWTTTNGDGTESTTSCRFSDCMKDGWTTTMPDGSEATTSCRFSDCMKDGWTTALPSGKTITCSCRFSDCLENGAECE